MRKDELRQMTRQELLEEARRRDVKGRSTMSKDELIAAIASLGSGRGRASDASTRQPARATGEASRPAAREPEVPSPRDEPEPGSPRDSADSTRPAPRSPRVDQRDPEPGRSAAPRPEGRHDPEDDEDAGWNSVALGRDPNYGRFLGGPQGHNLRQPPPRLRRPAGPPSVQSESLQDRSERGRQRAVERSFGAREELRRTGEARRNSAYVPQYNRPRGHQGRPDQDRPEDRRSDDRRPEDRRSERIRARAEYISRERNLRRDGARDRNHPGARSRRPDDRPLPPGSPDRRRIDGETSFAQDGSYGRTRPPRPDRRPIERIPGRVPSAEVPEPRPSAIGGAPADTSPVSYSIDRCRLQLRDSRVLHAFWEIGESALERTRREMGGMWVDRRSMARLHSYPAKRHPRAAAPLFTDIELAEGTTSHDAPADLPARLYRMDIGYMARNGLFFPVVSSNAVETAPDPNAPAPEPEWPSLEDTAGLTNTPEWSNGEEPIVPVQDQAADAIQGGESVPRDSVESLRSASRFDPEPLVDRTASLSATPDVQQGPGAEDAASSRQEHSFAESPSTSTPPGRSDSAEPEGHSAEHTTERGFWFVLNTELVIHGATAPGASVTVQGVTVPLRPDGTFTLRFPLGDGSQTLETIAISEDGLSRRTITPTIVRSTKSS